VSNRTAQAQTEFHDSIRRLPATLAIVGVSRSTWLDLVRRKQAPAPIRLSAKAVGWRESELRNWLDNRPSAR